MEINEKFLQNFIPYYKEYIEKYKIDIIKNFDKILKCAYNNKIDIYDILEILIELPEIREKINSKPEFVLACCTYKNITRVLDLLKEIDKIKEIRERDFETRKEKEDEDKDIDDIIISKLVNISVQELREEKILPFLKQLFNEIMEIEKLKIGDIKYLASGTRSNVFYIGEIVIKLGKDRATPKYKGHPNILRPILRMAIPKRENERNISDTYLDKDKLIFIEVQPYLNRGKKLSMSDNTLLNLYKKLGQDGLLWGDMGDENMTVINEQKVNEVYRKYPNPNLTGISKKDPIEPYRENGGIPVVSDADCIEER